MTVEKAIDLIEIACNQWSLGYDQQNRLDFRDGGETDCSALVIFVCEQAGLLPGNDIAHGQGATFTGNMRAAFQARGWEVHPVLPVSELRPGDVLLADGHHTAMYVGGGELAQASIDEDGNAAGGDLGNQTGGETVVRSFYSYPWSCVLRFAGTVIEPTPKDDIMNLIPLPVAANGTFRAAVMAEAGQSSAVIDAAWLTWGSTFGATQFIVSCLDAAGNVIPSGRREGKIANNHRDVMQVPSGTVMATVEGNVIDGGALPAAALVTRPK